MVYYFDFHAEQPVPAPHNKDNYANFIGFAFRADLSELYIGSGRWKGEEEMVHLLSMREEKERYKIHLYFTVSSSQAPSQCTDPLMLLATLKHRCSANTCA